MVQQGSRSAADDTASTPGRRVSGGVVAGLAGGGVLLSSYSQSNRLTVTLVIAVVLAISSILSVGFFGRLLDLARDYRDNLISMNIIKEFYIGRLSAQLPQLAAAFSRRLAHVPRRRVLGPGAAVMTATVAVLGSFALAWMVGQARQLVAIATDTSAPYLAEVHLAGLALPYAWEVLAGLVGLAAQLAYYRFASRARKA